MNKAVIIAAKRTPVGKLLGKLSPFTAPELASFVIKDIIRSNGIQPSEVDEVILGNVVSAGVGQNPARQAAIISALPNTIGGFTVNMVCASGLKAVALGLEAITCGSAGLILAGGMESMSNAPFLLRDLRRGKKYGDSAAVDAMVYDGLWDCYYDAHMGALCEHTVEKYGFSRGEQDRFAYNSHMKAASEAKAGSFNNEITPVKNADSIILDKDETIRPDTTLEALARLKPAFGPGGTITAGNSPGLNDGASALLLASEEKAKELGLKPIAEVLGFASAHLDPKWYTIAPVDSVKKLLNRIRLDINDFDLIEENEAFAAQTLAVMKELSLDPRKVNVNGGAIALGHPIGASGARVLTTLIHALRHRGKKLGLATICLGGGGSMSMAVRAL